MHLYGLTMQRGGAVSGAAFGSFSAAKAQEVAVARAGGRVLELLRHDKDQDQVERVCSTDVFGVIRALHAFRLTGGSIDYLVIGSDSGRISILRFDLKSNAFVKVHEETFGRSGCRRIVPGEFLAIDPNGRAVMIGAAEKQKFVYILTRDAETNLVISSPLAAHKAHTILFSMCGVDVGFDNPQFACIEVDFSESSPGDELRPVEARYSKMLAFYELDLGLNHVTRKHAVSIDMGSNLVLSVPGGNDGPGGVLITCEDKLIWYNIEQPMIRSPLPRRRGMNCNEKLLIVSHAVHRQKGFYFFLLQSEYGDLYKVTLQADASGQAVSEIIVQYFDSIPTASALSILQTGFLFAGSEFGNHYLFQFASIGENDDVVKTTQDSAMDEYYYFNPRKLKNLIMIDELESLCPITNMKVANIAQEESAQIYLLCGRGPQSTLKVLRNGLGVSEMAASEVPGSPNAVFCVKVNAADEFHKYILVSYSNATLVLSIGESVEEVSDSGFLTSAQTLHASLLGESTLLQVHSGGVRIIVTASSINEWQPPGKKEIVQCAVNRSQVVIAMTGAELAYFEGDDSGNLQEIDRKKLDNDISALALSAVPEGRRRARYLAIGCYDSTVRLLTLDEPNDPLRQITIQAVGAQPSSLLISTLEEQLYLFVGLQTGVLIRSRIDHSESGLSDARKRFLGGLPVKLTEVSVQGRTAVLSLSSRSWLTYFYDSKVQLTPLSYDTLAHATAFASEQCPEGIVAISQSTLRIAAVDRLGELFNTTSTPLRYTPRRFVLHPVTHHAFVIESDHRAYKHDELIKAFSGEDDNMRQEEDDDEEEINDFRGVLYKEDGQWASCIETIDPVAGESIAVLELEDNEAAFSIATVEFSDRGNELFLAVGTAKDFQLKPRSFTQGFIHIYRFVSGGPSLELLHKTPVEECPLALASFQGRLLVGAGKILRMYDIGKKKLLRKSENRNFPTAINAIEVQGDRAYVSDLAEAVHFVKYRKAEKQLDIVADMSLPRYMTASCILDYNTVAGADKFGNIFVSRLPEDVSEEVDTDPTTVVSALTGGAQGPQHKLNDIINFHVGDVVTSLAKVQMSRAGQSVLLYCTLGGTLGVFVPFTSREDADFFAHLEMHLRQRNKPLCGRDHLAYRSAYFPVKDCVDGDFCEQFSKLSTSEQAAVASELSFTSVDIDKKMEEVRNRMW